MLVGGIIYAWSILKAPLGEDFGWTAPQLALNFTLMMCFFCFGGIVSGIITRRFSPKLTLTLAAAISCTGFILASRLSGAIGMLYLSYGVFCGLGIGMAYNAVIATTGAWFPDKKGLCSGILMMGYGASALVLGNVAGAMINAPALGWRKAYLILGIVTGVVLLLTALVMRFPPEGTALPLPKRKAESSSVENFAMRDYTTGEMVKRISFWLFFPFAVTVAAVGNTVISFARDLALSVGASVSLATTLVGVLSVCNGLGRILCGVIFDNTGRRTTMLFVSAIAILAPIVVLIAVLTDSVVVSIIGLCLVGVAYGCGPTISSAFVSTFYGTKFFAMNFSIANIMLVPASFTATLASTLLASTGSYVAPFVMLVGLSLVGLVLNLNIKRP
jgi:OFA family oxalate/formate antiporter-like MFS transporter